MREILTIVAACVVAVLAAALAVPPFIDWNSHSAAIASRLGAGFGGRVALDGPVRLRLLPAPRLTAGALSAERPGLVLQARETALELSAPALLRGALEFTDVVLAGADIAVDPARLELAASPATSVAISGFRLTDATLRIAGAQPATLSHVDMNGAADSLAGPFRGQGVWRNGDAVAFTFSTGAVADGRLRGKFSFDAAAIKLHGEATGDLSLSGGAPEFSGTAVLSGILGPAPARASFALRAKAEGLHAEKIDARLGDDDHALNVSGAADFSRASGLDARLEASSLDLDRFRNAYAMSEFAEVSRAIALRTKLAADSVTLGGEALTNVALDFVAKPDLAPTLSVDAGLPGRTRLHYEGSIDPSGLARLDGAMRIETRDAAKLGAWLAPVAPKASRWLSAASAARLAYEGRVNANSDGVRLEARALDVDRSRLSGALDWRAQTPSGRSGLSARLRAFLIDVDSLPDIRSFAGAMEQDDLDLSLDADALRVARIGEAPAETGNLRIALSRSDGVTALRELTIRNLGGASLSGSGRATPQGGGFDFRLDAEKLIDLAALVRRVAPGAAAEALASRALALSPTHLTIGVATDAAGAFTQFNLAGDAGGARWSAQAEPAGAGRIQARLSAQAPEAAILLRQAGLTVLPLKGLGGGRLEAQGNGEIGGALQTRATLDLAGLALRFDGETILALDRAAAQGRLVADSDDLSRLAPLFAFGAPAGAGGLPLHGAAQLRLDGQGLALDAIEAEVARVHAAGNATRAMSGVYGGSLKLASLSAPDVLALVLGPPQPKAAGALWPTLKFAPARFDLPNADIALEVGRVDLGDTIFARNARGRLVLAPGSLALRDLAMDVSDGRVSGDATLRREVGAAIATAKLKGDNLAFAAGPLSARVKGALDLSGAGGSAAEMIASLAGSGHLAFSDARIAAAAPAALSKVVAETEASETALEPRNVADRLARFLDEGPQLLGPVESDITVSSGQIVLAPASARFGETRAQLGAALDLRSGLLDLRETLIQAPPQGFASAPRIDLSWTGALDGLRRDIHADALIATLAERAIVRETERNAALEADIRERVFFNRRLKMDRRNDEERRALEDARRLMAPPPRAPQPAQQEDKARSPARPPAAFAPATRGAAPDPSTAGRY